MSSQTAPAIRTCLRLDQWPKADQLAWTKAITPHRGPFRMDGGRTRNQFSIRMLASGYGRWLGFLMQNGQLDPTEAPAERVTLERLDAYFTHLRECGNADYSLVGRFDQLRRVLQWMYPRVCFRWITHPSGVAIRALLPMKRKSGLVPDSAVLLAWAEELFRKGLKMRVPMRRCAQVREAVMIGLLATRAPRLRALASLRIGVHLLRQDDEWLLDQDPAITKTCQSLMLPLSREVAGMLNRYLEVERVELLNGARNDALWISTLGKTLAEATIARRLRLRSKQRFGEAFGPHRYRASLATKLALDAPDNPLDASILLGHTSPEVTMAHYNRASALAASRRHSERLKRLAVGTRGAHGP